MKITQQSKGKQNIHENVMVLINDVWHQLPTSVSLHASDTLKRTELCWGVQRKSLQARAAWVWEHEHGLVSSSFSSCPGPNTEGRGSKTSSNTKRLLVFEDLKHIQHEKYSSVCLPDQNLPFLPPSHIRLHIILQAFSRDATLLPWKQRFSTSSALLSVMIWTALPFSQHFKDKMQRRFNCFNRPWAEACVDKEHFSPSINVTGSLKMKALM